MIICSLCFYFLRRLSVVLWWNTTTLDSSEIHNSCHWPTEKARQLHLVQQVDQTLVNDQSQTARTRFSGSSRPQGIVFSFHIYPDCFCIAFNLINFQEVVKV
jgi:hypothetical protein